MPSGRPGCLPGGVCHGNRVGVVPEQGNVVVSVPKAADLLGREAEKTHEDGPRAVAALGVVDTTLDVAADGHGVDEEVVDEGARDLAVDVGDHVEHDLEQVRELFDRPVNFDCLS